MKLNEEYPKYINLFYHLSHLSNTLYWLWWSFLWIRCWWSRVFFSFFSCCWFRWWTLLTHQTRVWFWKSKNIFFILSERCYWGWIRGWIRSACTALKVKSQYLDLIPSWTSDVVLCKSLLFSFPLVIRAIKINNIQNILKKKKTFLTEITQHTTISSPDRINIFQQKLFVFFLLMDRRGGGGGSCVCSQLCLCCCHYN